MSVLLPFVAVTARDIYDSAPPAPRTSVEVNPTLLVCWWCTAASLIVILIRTYGRYMRTKRFFTEDKLMMVGVIPLVVRMTLVHLVLVWGTNNTQTDGLSESDIQDRETGSRLVLAARIFYAVYIWMAKYTVCEFLRRLTGMVWTKTFQVALRAIEYFLASTLAVVIIATLVECRPFCHYWQVVPDPGPHCRLGYANLLAMGVCDILTDIFLVVLPVTLFVMSAMTVKRKIQLVLLFASSLILVAITGYRVPSVIRKGGLQNFRSLLASFEILAATAVSNFVVIGSFLRDRGLKRAKYKRAEGSLSAIDSIDCTSERRTTISKHHWGSDADLANGLGIRLDPELYATQIKVVRPAPPVVAHGAIIQAAAAVAGDTKSESDSRRSMENGPMASSLDVTRTVPAAQPQFIDINKPPSPGRPNVSPRSVSFYDVGGLLSHSTPSPRQHHQPIENIINSPETEIVEPAPPIHFRIPTYTYLQEHHERSEPFLHDVGGLITPQPDESDTTSTINRSEND